MSDGQHYKEDVFTKSIRAGKRTYFFDVKVTRGNDLYMTITESKRSFDDQGNSNYEKHKIFLYKEDLDKFLEGLQESIEKFKELKSSGNFNDDGPFDRQKKREEGTQAETSDVSFDDL
jgi:hypothetical protein